MSEELIKLKKRVLNGELREAIANDIDNLIEKLNQAPTAYAVKDIETGKIKRVYTNHPIGWNETQELVKVKLLEVEDD